MNKQKMFTKLLENNITKIKKDWYVRQTESLEKGIVSEIITDIDILL